MPLVLQIDQATAAIEALANLQPVVFLQIALFIICVLAMVFATRTVTPLIAALSQAFERNAKAQDELGRVLKDNATALNASEKAIRELSTETIKAMSELGKTLIADQQIERENLKKGIMDQITVYKQEVADGFQAIKTDLAGQQKTLESLETAERGTANEMKSVVSALERIQNKLVQLETLIAAKQAPAPEPAAVPTPPIPPAPSEPAPPTLSEQLDALKEKPSEPKIDS